MPAEARDQPLSIAYLWWKIHAFFGAGEEGDLSYGGIGR